MVDVRPVAFTNTIGGCFAVVFPSGGWIVQNFVIFEALRGLFGASNRRCGVAVLLFLRAGTGVVVYPPGRSAAGGSGMEFASVQRTNVQLVGDFVVRLSFQADPLLA